MDEGRSSRISAESENRKGRPEAALPFEFGQTGLLLAVGGERTEQDEEVTHRRRAVVVEVGRTVVLGRHLTGAVIDRRRLVIVVGLGVGAAVAVIRAAVVVEQGDGRVVAGSAVRAGALGAAAPDQGRQMHAHG